jgi:hypothetical protein
MGFTEHVDTSTPIGDRSAGTYSIREIEKALLAAFSETVVPAMQNVLEALFPFLRLFYQEGQARAVHVVMTQAFNDYSDLTYDLIAGRGRSAIRVSRALYEHLVHYCEVSDNANSAQRYEDHEAVTARHITELRIGLDLLRGNEKRAEEHRLAKLRRDSQPDYNSAIASYGTKFKLSWLTQNLHDTALRHGLAGSNYEAYRLLSQVPHGSYGGILGTYRDFQGRGVYRTGNSFDLAILAYYEGIRFFTMLIREVSKRSQVLPCEGLLDSLGVLQSLWPFYRKVMKNFDEEIWPDSAPAQASAVVKLYGSGKARWYFYEPAFELMALADPPAEARELENELRAHAEEQGLLDRADPDKYVVMIANTAVKPRSGARLAPARAVLDLKDDAPIEIVEPGR